MAAGLESTQRTYAALVRPCIVDGQISRRRTVSYSSTLHSMLEPLGIPENKIHALRKAIFDIITSEESEAVAARATYQLLWSYSGISDKLDRRAEHIARQVQPYLAGTRLLDYGGGDGRVLTHLDLSGMETVALYDLRDVRTDAVKRRSDITFGSEEDFSWVLAAVPFDTVLLLTVLHHAEDPRAEIDRIKRLLRPGGRIVVIESIISPFIPLQVQAFADWFYNRCLNPGANIPVPGNWKTSYAWRQFFASKGFRLVGREDLDIDHALVPEHHEISAYVLTP